MAYLALVIAILGVTTTAAAAAFIVHTRNIANRAVTNPKIRNQAVGTHKIRVGAVGNARIRNNAVGTRKITNGGVHRVDIANHAVNGHKVANNSLTGTQINESTLNVARIAHRISGHQTVTADSAWPGVAYPLTAGNRYMQPAHTADTYFGEFRVHFPAGCTGSRHAAILISVGDRQVATGFAEDASSGSLTAQAPIEGGWLFLDAATAHRRHVTAHVIGFCNGPATEPHPQVRSVTIHVGRFR